MEQSHRTIPFPRARRAVVDAGRLASRRHIVHGLLEIDVTRARRLIRDHSARTGERLSFTGFIITCLAQAVQAQPTVQAYRNWRNQLVIFEDVDVVTLIETEVGGVALRPSYTGGFRDAARRGHRRYVHRFRPNGGR